MNDILQTLNPAQQEAVLATEGPVLILAGAGSGKTRALTARIAYLISEKHVAPWNILAITFTNKAAAEMRERVNALAAGDAAAVWVGTFHATCVRILRRHAEGLGYTNRFTIYDTDDQKTLMKRVMKALDMDSRMYPERMLISRISAAKNRMQTPDEMAKEAGSNYREMRVADAYVEYQNQLKSNDAMDFDDLLVKTVELFTRFPEVLAEYQNRWKYLMVDEYQDTNHVQFELIRLLAGKRGNLCVVGDDDQSIYKFRGADISNILDFEKTFPNTKVVKLEQNYRSTKNILNVANEIIKNNHGRKAKRLWTDHAAGDQVDFKAFESAYDEAEYIVRDIERHRAQFAFGSCAVLYRTNAQSRILEEFCVRENVPYRLVGGVNFYQRKEIKDLIAYVKTVAGGLDDLAVRRIINEPKRGIGATTINRITDWAAERGLGFYEALERCGSIDGLSGGTVAKLNEFLGLIEGIRMRLPELTVKELIEAVANGSGYLDALRAEHTVESEGRLENIDELLNKAEEYGGIEDTNAALDAFLADVSLIADVDAMEADEDRVVLMTLHGAKGLEFPRVYMAGMEEGLFPGSMAIYSEDDTDMEEERRLCYVGVTRAKEKLTLTAAKKRMVNGETRFSPVSRFVEEIPKDLLKTDSAGGSGRGFGGSDGDGYGRRFSTEREGFGSRFGRDDGEAFANRYGSSSAGSGAGRFGSTPAAPGRRHAAPPEKVTTYLGSKPVPGTAGGVDYGVGDRVRHVKFGEGTVKDMVQGRRDWEVTVEFDDVGIKKLFAAFAGLKKV